MHAISRGTLAAAVFGLTSAVSVVAPAAEYQIDPTHSFVEFKIQHLGYSWMFGRFDKLAGTFSFDAAKPEASVIGLDVDTSSINTNHAERDKHLRGGDFLEVDKFAKASFKSTGYKGSAEKGVLSGVLSFHGVDKPIEVAVSKVGEGKDPWGGYRAGFVGTYTMTRADFGVKYELGPASNTVDLTFGIEGIKK